MRSWVITIALFLSIAAAADPGAPQWYKGVTHVHSLWSDGDMSPDLIAAWYKDRGYNFVCLSDHNVLLEGERYVSIVDKTKLTPERVDMIRQRFGDDWLEIKEENGKPRMRLKTHRELGAHFNEPGKFLLVPAEEITSLGTSPHVGAVNIRERILGRKGGVSDLLNQYLDELHAQREKYGIPMFVHVNHLNWSDGVTTEEMLSARRLRFFEIYNGHPGVRQWGSPEKGMPDNDRHWDVILSIRAARDPEFILYALATDDSHEYFEWGPKMVNPGRGWIMVRAEELEANSLVAAIERADFYASTGVTLNDVRSDGKSLRVDIAAEPGVTYTTQFIGTRKGFDETASPFKNANGETPDTASMVYSSQIGVVLAETAENPAVYTFAGDELYVRAKVVSSKPQDNPVHEDDPQIAWVQPVRVAK